MVNGFSAACRTGVYSFSAAVTKSGRTFAGERTSLAYDRARVGRRKRRLRGLERGLRLLQRSEDAAEHDVVAGLEARVARRHEHADLGKAGLDRCERLRPRCSCSV